MELVVVPFASRLHEREYYVKLFERVRDVFASYGVKVLDIIDSEDGLSEAVVNEVGSSVPVFLILTGGSSRLAVELISRGNVRRVLTLSHSQHNSLASAISTRAKVEAEGVAVRNYFCRELGGKECLEVVEKVVRVGRALAKLLGVKVGVIGEVSSDDVKKFEETLNARVHLVSYEEFERCVGNVRDDEVAGALPKVARRVNVDGVDNVLLKEVIRVYLAMRGLALSKGLDALAIDCFPYIVRYGVTPCLAVSLLNDDGLVTACEADLRSLALMLALSALGAKASWMANLVSINGRKLTLAHCTIAAGLGGRCRLVPHFETRRPYSLACSLSDGVYTVVSIDREYSLVAALKAVLVRSGLLSDSMCRTQAVLEAGVDLSELPNIALSNHHVLVPGDVASELRELSYLLFMDFTTYDSIVRHMTGEL